MDMFLYDNLAFVKKLLLLLVNETYFVSKKCVHGDLYPMVERIKTSTYITNLSEAVKGTKPTSFSSHPVIPKVRINLSETIGFLRGGVQREGVTGEP